MTEQNLNNQEEIWLDDVSQLETEEYSQDQISEMHAFYDSSLNDIKRGEVVDGKIINISPIGVAVDIGFKSEGVISSEEFDDIDNFNPGDSIRVYLESVEGKDGKLVLSKKKADFLAVWEDIRKFHGDQTIIKGKCLRRVKGGIVVDVLGIDAFLPGSQIDVYPVRDFDALIGQTMDFKIVKLNEQRKNIVLSRKIILEGELFARRDKTLQEIKVGDVKEAIVKNITDFGVFVDINGLDGLIYITDLSWGRVNHPSEICKLDQTINVQILDIDYDKKRVSAGLKQLAPHPWEGIEEKYPVGHKVTGKVVSITDYGAFIEIEKGIEGLIHITEMSWVQHAKHPSHYLHLGDVVEAVVLSIKKDEKKISLGIKQLEPDPWAIIEEKYPVGSKHSGVIRNLTAFGAFVELEEGIDGLIHISDLSWTKKIRHPKDLVKKGQEIEIIVLDINREERRISLGHKQLNEDPWDTHSRNLAGGTIVEGTVVKKIEKGFVVSITSGTEKVEGILKKSALDLYPSLNEGDTINMIVELFDKDSKKIILNGYNEDAASDADIQNYTRPDGE
jgi:small subunit ribosomal protein S1